MNNPTDPPEEEDRLRPGTSMPTTTGGSAAASSGGRAAAAAVGASVKAAGQRMVTRKVVLYRNPECKSFGVQLKSPGEKEGTNSIGCLIKAVLPSCLASEGTILPGDQLLSINGKLVLDWPCDEIVSCINELTSGTLMMSIRRELPKAAGASNAAAAASSAGGGATGAAGAAAATGTAGVPDGDPQLDHAGSAVPAAAVASSPDRGRGTRRRTPRQGTIPNKEQFQAPSPSPCRGSREDRWNSNIEALRKYKKEKGNCNVPQKYPPNQSLSEFVHYVRAKRNVLSEERREMLLELGFVFNTHEAAWENKFREVEEFCGGAGCYRISMSALRSKKPGLYDWIGKQRAAYARLRRGETSTMTDDKISRLEKIGIDLDPSGKFAEGGGGGGSRRESRKKKKPSGPTSSGSSSSARAKSHNFRSHNRPRRRQMANQQGKIPAAGKAARGPQKQVARKRLRQEASMSHS